MNFQSDKPLYIQVAEMIQDIASFLAIKYCFEKIALAPESLIWAFVSLTPALLL